MKFVLKFLYNSFFHKSLEDDTLSQKVVERIKLSKVFHLFVAIAASWDKRSPGAAEQYKSNGKSIIYHRDVVDINLDASLFIFYIWTPLIIVNGGPNVATLDSVVSPSMSMPAFVL